MVQFEQYWLFAVLCLVVAALVLRAVLREHVTLQASLWFLLIMLGVAVFALVPDLSVRVAGAMGFTLPSNFFFSLGIGGLTLLHVHTLLILSRTELRSTTLTQEVALLRERVDRMAAASVVGRDSADADVTSR